jgi:hypothetical protein
VTILSNLIIKIRKLQIKLAIRINRIKEINKLIFKTAWNTRIDYTHEHLFYKKDDKKGPFTYNFNDMFYNRTKNYNFIAIIKRGVKLLHCILLYAIMITSYPIFFQPEPAMTTTSNYSFDLETAEISDYNAEIGMLGEDEQTFLRQGGLEDQSTEWDQICGIYDAVSVVRLENDIRLSDEEWEDRMSGWFGF